jgi:hypothetical protein
MRILECAGSYLLAGIDVYEKRTAGNRSNLFPVNTSFVLPPEMVKIVLEHNTGSGLKYGVPRGAAPSAIMRRNPP